MLTIETRVRFADPSTGRSATKLYVDGRVVAEVYDNPALADMLAAFLPDALRMVEAS